MFFGDFTFILLIPVMILAFYAQNKVKSNYMKFSKIANYSRMSGKEVAQRILKQNGIYDVQVLSIDGNLTDHYDPRTKEVKLSSGVYNGRSISSMSIAAHEVGHALQHATGYVFLNIRASIIPVAQLGSRGAFPLFIIGMLMRMPMLMDLGIILFVGALAFHLITLPVELDASSRALKQLENNIMIADDEIKGSKAVLNAAALTYIASTLMALVNLLRLLILRGNRN